MRKIKAIQFKIYIKHRILIVKIKKLIIIGKKFNITKIETKTKEQHTGTQQ